METLTITVDCEPNVPSGKWLAVKEGLEGDSIVEKPFPTKCTNRFSRTA